MGDVENNDPFRFIDSVRGVQFKKCKDPTSIATTSQKLKQINCEISPITAIIGGILVMVPFVFLTGPQGIIMYMMDGMSLV